MDYDNFRKLYEYIKNNKEKINEHINISRFYNNYFQLSFVENNKKYPLKDIHFEIVLDKKDKSLCNLDIHFEKEDTTMYQKNTFLNQIINDDEDAIWIPWRYKGKNNTNNKSIRFNKKFRYRTELERDAILNYLIEKHKKYNDIILRKESILNNYNTEKGKKVNIKNIIIYGVPGVGKTHNINRLINLIEEDDNSQKEIFDILKNNEKANTHTLNDELNKRVKFITFHQSFGYEDFIEGFRPNKEGKIELVDGIFKNICKEAQKNTEKNYYLIIDEINRGNISKIFGELITLIEESKRDNIEVTLPYSKEPFIVPSNLYIIGTMNSTDKSIALIDIALRRRFTFVKLEPNVELIEDSEAKDLFKLINDYIINSLGKDYQIGHSYFMGDIDLDFVLEYKIKPLLEEYFYGDEDKLNEVLSLVGFSDV